MLELILIHIDKMYLIFQEDGFHCYVAPCNRIDQLKFGYGLVNTPRICVYSLTSDWTAADVNAWMSDYIPWFYTDVITYPYPNPMLV